MMFLMPSRLNSSIGREPFKSALLAIRMTGLPLLSFLWCRSSEDMQWSRRLRVTSAAADASTIDPEWSPQTRPRSLKSSRVDEPKLRNSHLTARIYVASFI